MNMEEILARLWLIVATSSSFETKDYPNCIVMKQDLKTLLTAYEKEKEKNKNIKKENKKLNLVRLQYLVSSFPDTTETYKKYKKELDELIKEE